MIVTFQQRAKFLKSLPRGLLVFWMIATAFVCLGMLLSQFRDKPLTLASPATPERAQRSVSPLVAAEASSASSTQAFPLPDIALGDFRVFVEEKRGIILDARPEIFYRLGHVPGALPLPRDDFEKGYARLQETLEANRNQAMVVYCSGESCEDSELVRQALVGLGYIQVAVFRGGWEAWTGVGLPEEKSE